MTFTDRVAIGGLVVLVSILGAGYAVDRENERRSSAQRDAAIAAYKKEWRDYKSICLRPNITAEDKVICELAGPPELPRGEAQQDAATPAGPPKRKSSKGLDI